MSVEATGVRLEVVFFFNDTATTEIYTLSLHDALPISHGPHEQEHAGQHDDEAGDADGHVLEEGGGDDHDQAENRSEEHTSELQSRQYLVCRLLLEKKKHIRKYGSTKSSASHANINDLN